MPRYVILDNPFWSGWTEDGRDGRSIFVVRTTSASEAEVVAANLRADPDKYGKVRIASSLPKPRKNDTITIASRHEAPALFREPARDRRRDDPKSRDRARRNWRGETAAQAKKRERVEDRERRARYGGRDDEKDRRLRASWDLTLENFRRRHPTGPGFVAFHSTTMEPREVHPNDPTFAGDLYPLLDQMFPEIFPALYEAVDALREWRRRGLVDPSRARYVIRTLDEGRVVWNSRNPSDLEYIEPPKRREDPRKHRALQEFQYEAIQLARGKRRGRHAAKGTLAGRAATRAGASSSELGAVLERAQEKASVRSPFSRLRRRASLARDAEPRCPVGMKVQSIIVSDSHFDRRDAVGWIERHGYVARKIDRSADSYRFRQVDPSRFAPGSFRTIAMRPGVKAVVGCPR